MSNFKAKQGQDKWVLSVLKNKRKGFFIDIGAHNGIDDSNSYVLEKDFEWDGICIEPHSRSFNYMQDHRSCICEKVCISNVNGKVKFVERGRHKQISGICDDFADEQILEQAKKGHPIIEKDSITLLNLLEKRKCNRIIDYLSIDVEGAELEILKDFVFDEYKFLTLTLEHNAPFGKKNDDKRKEIFALLTSKGYKRVDANKWEDWYVYCPNISKIIKFDELEMLGNYYRSVGKTIVSTNGCFDILHRGHIVFLEKCRSYGDIFIVGLNSDLSVKSIKGDDRPIMDENSRVSIMSHIDLVNHICVFNELIPSEMLSRLKTDVHCKGADYSAKDLPEKDIIEDNGGRIEIIPLDPGYSTTRVVNKINND